MTEVKYSGYVAVVGRPNVGKSTLINHLLGQKISITSRKPQTTRHRILGIKTQAEKQFVYVDTPGLHQHANRVLNRYMNRTALTVLHEVDVVVFMVDACRWNSQDEWILNYLQKLTVPIILAVNKIDKIPDRKILLPYLKTVAERYSFAEIIPLSAKSGEQINILENSIGKYLPEGKAFFPEDQITDRSDQFMATEMVREKLMRFLGQELPYAITVTIDVYEEQPQITRIAAVIWVEKASQKSIVIGEAGAGLKMVGQKARLDLEKYLKKKVFLQLWVKVKSGWSNDEKSLQQLGYGE